jgi:diketogulonate reductase-like aldo/keto reductase
MHTRPIPSSGEPLPIVGLGTWQAFDVGAAQQERDPLVGVIHELTSHGGTLIDASPMYGRAEDVVGALTEGANDLFIATKVWTSGRAAGVAQMETSMRRLRRSMIDLMQVHNLVDAKTHLATLRAWKEEARVRYIGITHYTASAYGEVEALLRTERVDFLQINYSALEREAEARVLPLARERGVAVIANRPFAEGALLRRLSRRPLPDWSAELGATSWSQLLLKFVLSHPAITCAIPATSSAEHMRENVIAGSGTMPDEAMRKRIASAVG